MEENICPYCNSEETYMDYDKLYEADYVVRKCETCRKQYKVTYLIEVIGVEKIKEDD